MGHGPMDISIQGPGVAAQHCYIENRSGVITLHPCGNLCAVDGLQVKQPTRLSQGRNQLKRLCPIMHCDVFDAFLFCISCMNLVHQPAILKAAWHLLGFYTEQTSVETTQWSLYNLGVVSPACWWARSQLLWATGQSISSLPGRWKCTVRTSMPVQ